MQYSYIKGFPGEVERKALLSVTTQAFCDVVLTDKGKESKAMLAEVDGKCVVQWSGNRHIDGVDMPGVWLLDPFEAEKIGLCRVTVLR